MLCSFIRAKICLSVAFMTASGYLLFNRPSADAILVSLSSFFICAGVYSFNNITDKKEDSVNRKRTADFLLNGTGLFLSFLFSVAGFVASAILSLHTLFFSLLFIITGLAYSSLRIKKYTLVKNLYTGFLIALLFLLGTMNFNDKTIKYYLLIAVFFLTGSIISDLRDYEGDKFAGLKTLPLRIGRKSTKRAVYLLLAGTIFLALRLDTYALFPFLIISPVTLYFTAQDKFETAHTIGGTVPIFLMLWLMI
ncbi:Digeranylgeranylglyceryl phosphate synthase [uncultured archaeon]|nr:Digeranylgeranylglyceryl phosphate synthase [uncultured archaeon]